MFKVQKSLQEYKVYASEKKEELAFEAKVEVTNSRGEILMSQHLFYLGNQPRYDEKRFRSYLQRQEYKVIDEEIHKGRSRRLEWLLLEINSDLRKKEAIYLKNII